ncbi:MAG: VOC family protein [Ruminococcus flavefaciens]|nr:VOC family protein [Ruminococcus flavefaciens]
MKLCTVYIMVNDIKKSVDFYRQLLQEEPLYSNDDRWVQFSNHIALYNYRYDKKIMESDSTGNFSQTYIEDFNKSKENPKNDIVVFNFETEDLKKEYQRLKNLNIGEVSDLMYVNIHMPYWYFNITDPDGNVIEITGQYN